MLESDILAIIDRMEKYVLQLIVDSITKTKTQPISPPPSPPKEIATRESTPLDRFQKVKELLNQIGPNAGRAKNESTKRDFDTETVEGLSNYIL